MSGLKTADDGAQALQLGWAAERTALAWVRTGAALMGLGFVVARFGLFLHAMQPGAEGSNKEGPALVVGIAMVGLGVVVSAASSVRYARQVARLRRGEPVRLNAALGAAVGLALSFVGLLLAALLAVTAR